MTAASTEGSPAWTTAASSAARRRTAGLGVGQAGEQLGDVQVADAHQRTESSSPHPRIRVAQQGSGHLAITLVAGEGGAPPAFEVVG